MSGEVQDANEAQRRYWNTVAGPRWVASPGFRERRNQESLALLLDASAACRRRERARNRLRHRRGDTAARRGGRRAWPRRRGRHLRADARGRSAAGQRERLHNVTLLLGDAQVLAFEPAAFDLATSRMGVMFFADPVAAFRNIGGALKPGGRLVFACWAPLAENRHWLISYDIALRHLGPPAPSPAHEPGPLAFADPDYIRRVLAAAGFAEITVERAHPTIIGGSPEEEARQALMMGPTARLIEAKKPAEATRQTDRRGDCGGVRRRSQRRPDPTAGHHLSGHRSAVEGCTLDIRSAPDCRWR